MPHCTAALLLLFLLLRVLLAPSLFLALVRVSGAVGAPSLLAATTTTVAAAARAGRGRFSAYQLYPPRHCARRGVAVTVAAGGARQSHNPAHCLCVTHTATDGTLGQAMTRGIHTAREPHTCTTTGRLGPCTAAALALTSTSARILGLLLPPTLRPDLDCTSPAFRDDDS